MGSPDEKILGRVTQENPWREHSELEGWTPEVSDNFENIDAVIEFEGNRERSRKPGCGDEGFRRDEQERELSDSLLRIVQHNFEEADDLFEEASKSLKRRGPMSSRERKTLGGEAQEGTSHQFQERPELNHGIPSSFQDLDVGAAFVPSTEFRERSTAWEEAIPEDVIWNTLNNRMIGDGEETQSSGSKHPPT